MLICDIEPPVGNGRSMRVSRIIDTPTVERRQSLHPKRELLAHLAPERRIVVPLERIPATVVGAFLAVEDRRFFQHDGIDYQRAMGALVRDVQTLSFEQGFSTITMQLARNVFPEHLTREKTLRRKLWEIVIARQIEEDVRYLAGWKPRSGLTDEVPSRRRPIYQQEAYGDRWAPHYDEIYSRYSARVRSICRRMLGNSADAEEATQETFLRSYKALHRFNGQYQLSAWLSRIASNICVDHLRQRSRHPETTVQTEDDDREAILSRVRGALAPLRDLGVAVLIAEPATSLATATVGSPFITG